MIFTAIISGEYMKIKQGFPHIAKFNYPVYLNNYNRLAYSYRRRSSALQSQAFPSEDG